MNGLVRRLFVSQSVFRRTLLLYSTSASRIVKDATGTPMSIDITDAAEQKLKKVLKDGQSFLRLTVEAGGCHGFQYKFALDSSLHSDDIVFKRDGACVVIDEISLPFIAGSQVDHVNELIGNYFKVVNNPLAGTGCGCGVSFDYQPLKPGEFKNGHNNK